MLDASGAPGRFVESPQEYEANFGEMVHVLDGDEMAYVHPAPHSVLQTSAEMLALGNALANAHDLPLHLHLADSDSEIAASKERFGRGPVEYLQDLGVLDERLLAVHAVSLGANDIDRIAECGAAVVHNPSSNAFLGSGIAPLAALRDRGITVCLGTDAASANSRQSIFEEMRMAALLAKARARDASVITADEALLLGTEAGGRALRLPVGRIAPGYFADLVAIDLTTLSMQPAATATQNLVYSMQPESIAFVIVAGRKIAENGRLLTLNIDRLTAAVNEVTGRWAPLTSRRLDSNQPALQ
jgi:5-methylthioadenosine/S-adenosylhomocysteine deaminase